MREAVIVSTARTPIGRAARGSLNITHGAEMAAHAITHALSRAGVEGREVEEVSPRADAIRRALEIAEETDTVIVTGKGHEPTQEIAGVFHRYNDRDVYLAALAERADA